MKEVTVSIGGYGLGYSVTSTGIVINNNTGKRLKTNHNSVNGYDYVTIYYAKNEKKLHSIHRLVANAFIENTEKKLTVNHKNGIKTDNRVDNLEWATLNEQQLHAYRKLGKPVSRRKQGVIAIDINGNKKKFESCLLAAKFFNVHPATISNALTGKIKICREHKFQYP